MNLRLLFFLSAFIFSSSARPSSARVPIIHIGVVMDMTTQRSASEDTMNGLRVAAILLKEDGRGNVKLDVIDSTPLAVGTRTAMLEMVKHENDLIIAEIASSKAEVAAEVAEKSGRVMITPFASAFNITENRKYVFRACANHQTLVSKLTKYLVDHAHFTNVYSIYDESQLYSADLHKRFVDFFGSSGGKVIASQKLSDFNSKALPKELLNKSTKNDFIFLPTYEESAAKVIARLISSGLYNKTIVGADGWQPDDAFNSVVFSKKPDFEGYFVTHHSIFGNSKRRKEFDSTFLKTYGKLPQTSAAYLAFDSVELAVEAVKKARDRSQLAIRESLANNVVLNGLSGTIEFHGHQDPFNKPLYLNRFIGRKVVETKEL